MFGRRRERRAWPGGYEASLLATVEAQAAGGAFGSAMAETVASFWADTLAGCMVDGTDLVGPADMSAIGRDLVLDGESVWLFRTGPDRLDRAWARPDMEGQSIDRNNWVYRLTMPTASATMYVPGVLGSSVVHHRWDPRWDETTARSPLSNSSVAAFDTAERGIGLEAAKGGGYVLPVDASGGRANDDTENSLRTAIAGIAARSGLIVIPGAQKVGGGALQLGQARIGFSPTEHQTEALRDLWARSLSTVGLAPGLLESAGRSGQWRVFRVQRLQPRCNMLAAEYSRVLETPVTIRATPDAADGLSLRSGALKRLVDAGIPAEDARKVVDL